MNVKFKLKKSTNDQSLILCAVYSRRFKNNQIILSTSIKVVNKYWDSDNERAIRSKKYPEHTYINASLDQFKHKLLEAVQRIRTDQKELNIQNLKEQFSGNIQVSVPTDIRSEKLVLFTDYMNRVIEENRPFYNPARKRYIILCDGTIKSRKQTLSTVKGFQKHTNKSFLVHEIDLAFYQEFRKYLVDKKYKPNTIGRHIKDIKTILRRAENEGTEVSPDYKKPEFTPDFEETQSVYLTEEELEKIANASLTGKPGLDKVRDLFLVACYTGVRFSDFSELHSSNILAFKQGRVFKVRTQKTKEWVYIPIHKKVEQILTKYDNSLPKVISNQKMNKAIKDICEVAGINDRIQLNRAKDNNLNPKKFLLITTHTARRTFATNAYKAGIPTLKIMKITGHRTETSFLKYIRFSKEENALELLTHTFFN